MPIETVDLFTRALLKSRPNDLFVFGDNMERIGLGGQAAACRGEPNAVGIPTKWAPSSAEAAFFKDADFAAVKYEINRELAKLASHLGVGGTVVLPSAGIGTGLAELPTRAPMIFRHITESFAALRQLSNRHSTGCAPCSIELPNPSDVRENGVK